MIEQINRAIDKKLRGIRQAFRGVIRLVKAAGQVQLLQVDGLAGERLQDNELMQHYGFTSNPPGGTMCVVIPVGGKTAHGIIVATEHGNYRLAGFAEGEVAIYDDQGQKVHITRAGIVIDGAGKPVTVQNAPTITLDSPDVYVTRDLHVARDMIAARDVFDHTNKSMLAMRAAYNSHTHTEHDGPNTAGPSGGM